MQKQPFYLANHDDVTPFPPVDCALDEPNGLLAVGGRLSSQRLLLAYRHGIFPWFSEGQPILWWSPNPRAVLFPEQFKISTSLRKTLRSNRFRVTFDCAFSRVIAACAAPRKAALGTWITQEMVQAYQHLHQQGYAHSVETWYQDQLVGGLYGIQLGKLFFGESMFSTQTDASKVALYELVQYALNNHLPLIDCQVPSAHLQSLGATTLPRQDFIQFLADKLD